MKVVHREEYRPLGGGPGQARRQPVEQPLFVRSGQHREGNGFVVREELPDQPEGKRRLLQRAARAFDAHGAVTGLLPDDRFQCGSTPHAGRRHESRTQRPSPARTAAAAAAAAPNTSSRSKSMCCPFPSSSRCRGTGPEQCHPPECRIPRPPGPSSFGNTVGVSLRDSRHRASRLHGRSRAGRGCRRRGSAGVVEQTPLLRSALRPCRRSRTCAPSTRADQAAFTRPVAELSSGAARAAGRRRVAGGLPALGPVPARPSSCGNRPCAPRADRDGTRSPGCRCGGRPSRCRCRRRRPAEGEGGERVPGARTGEEHAVRVEQGRTRWRSRPRFPGYQRTCGRAGAVALPTVARGKRLPGHRPRRCLVDVLAEHARCPFRCNGPLRSGASSRATHRRR